MNFMIRHAAFSIVLLGFSACSTQRATLPNAGLLGHQGILDSRELELSQQAALDAAKSARDASLESERVQRQIAELKSDVEKLSALAGACSDLAKKSEQKRAYAAALRAKKAPGFSFL